MERYIVEVDENGTTTWKNEAGQLHRLDGPAIEYAFGTKIWYQNGKRHRLDGPALETKGHKEWWIDGIEYSKQEFLSKTYQLRKSNKCLVIQ